MHLYPLIGSVLIWTDSSLALDCLSLGAGYSQDNFRDSFLSELLSIAEQMGLG